MLLLLWGVASLELHAVLCVFVQSVAEARVLDPFRLSDI